MRPGQILTVFSAAGICVIPGATAALGYNCLSALKSISPRRIVENVQRHSCDAGCQPRLAESAHYWKDIIRGLVADGADYIQFNDPAAEQAMADWMDQVFEDMRSTCEPKLHDDYGCYASDLTSEVMKCIDDNTMSSMLRNAHVIFPHISEKRCKKVEEYYNSPQMWEVSFPARMKEYVEHCHDEL